MLNDDELIKISGEILENFFELKIELLKSRDWRQ